MDNRSGPATLTLSAGADKRVAVDGLSSGAIAAVRAWSGSGAVVACGDEQLQLVDRLVEVGAVQPDPPAGCDVELVGTDGLLLERLADRLHDSGVAVVRSASAELAVVVRAGRHWPQPPDRMHVGLDVSLHHTVVLGPLVVPGVTACLGCAEQRAVRRWGEPAVPTTPAVTRRAAAVADLLAIQVELVAAGTSPLVNATIAWDLEHGTCERQSVYKLVGCRACDVAPSTGRVTLPWLAGEPAEQASARATVRASESSNGRGNQALRARAPSSTVVDRWCTNCWPDRVFRPEGAPVTIAVRALPTAFDRRAGR